jgi:hypothetical protein
MEHHPLHHRQTIVRNGVPNIEAVLNADALADVRSVRLHCMYTLMGLLGTRRPARCLRI